MPLKCSIQCPRFWESPFLPFCIPVSIGSKPFLSKNSPNKKRLSKKLKTKKPEKKKQCFSPLTFSLSYNGCWEWRRGVQTLCSCPCIAALASGHEKPLQCCALRRKANDRTTFAHWLSCGPAKCRNPLGRESELVRRKPAESV